MSEIYDCTICGVPITDAYMYGDGDGYGHRFAHSRCYHGRSIQSGDPEEKKRAERWFEFADRYPTIAERQALIDHLD